MIKYVWIIFIIIILHFSCKNTSGTENPKPGKVQWVMKVPDTVVSAERGIDAVAGMPKVIQLEWKSVHDEDILSYNLYVSTDNRNYFPEYRLRVETAGQSQNFIYNSEDSTYTFYYDIFEIDHGLADPYNKILYFYIIAEDEIGQKSESSDTLHYTLDRAIGGLSIIVDTNGDSIFVWNWNNLDVIPNQIIFRLEKEILPSNWNPEFVKLLSSDNAIFHGQYFDSPQIFLKDLINNYHVVLSPGNYRFRIDVYNNELWGSESNWYQFRVQ